MENIDLLTQVGLSLTAIILASNTLTNLFKFIIPEDHKFRTQFVRLLNFGFAMLITGLLVVALDIDNASIVGVVVSIIGALGAEKLYDSNKVSGKSEIEGEDFEDCQ